MSKHINIIARSNGVGLDSDVTLLQTALKQLGYEVTFSHCRSRSIWSRLFGKNHTYDANLFLERVFPAWFSSAPINLLIPNQERFPERHLHRLKRIDHILCKSLHAKEIFTALGHSSKYISFTSKDVHLNDEIPNYSQFFHLAGRSTLKGTATIIKLWKKRPHWPLLTLVQHKENAPDPATLPSNIRLISEYLPYDELIKLSNKNGIHLCPSLSEGWGHYIVEAMSARAVVITTDAPPMNELIQPDRGLLVKHNRNEPRHLGTNYYIDETALEKTIDSLLAMSSDQKKQLGDDASRWFNTNHHHFVNRLNQSLSEIL